MGARTLSIMVLLSVRSIMQAQTADVQFDLCVKQFDEFRDRFNGHYNAPPDPTGTAMPPDHAALLKSLLATGLDARSSEAFINDVLNAKPAFTLDLDGEPWFAQVKCGVQLGDKNMEVMFWLVREHTGDAHKWSILGTDLRHTAQDSSLFIDSRNHECGFTDLLRKERMQEHGVAPYIGPPSVAGLFAVQEALMQDRWHITNVKQVRMELLQVPGWFAEVEYRPPPDRTGWITSGWNIVRLERMSDRLKPRYIWNHVLGL